MEARISPPIIVGGDHSAIPLQRKRLPDEINGPDPKRQRVETRQSRLADHNDSADDSKAGESVEDALEYLFALPLGHKLSERNLEKVMDWAGPKQRLREVICDPYRRLVEQIVKQGQVTEDSQRQRHLTDEVEQRWVERVLSQLLWTLDHKSIFASESKTWEAESGMYKVKLQVVPVFNLDDDAESTQDRDQNVLNGRHENCRHEENDENSQYSEDGGGEDGTNQVDHMCDEADDEVRNENSEDSGVVMDEDAEEDSASRVSGDEAAVPETSIRRTSVSTLQPGEFVTNYPDVPCPKRTIRFDLHGRQGAYPADADIRTAFEASLADVSGGDGFLSLRKYSRFSWTALYTDAESASTAAEITIMEFGRDIKLRMFSPISNVDFLCRRMPDEITSMTTAGHKVLETFYRSCVVIRWTKKGMTPVTRKARNGQLLIRFQHPVDVERFCLRIPLKDGSVFPALFNNVSDDCPKCAVCCGRAHRTARCPCLRTLEFEEPHPRLLQAL
jgi:hypothetical protein